MGNIEPADQKFSVSGLTDLLTAMKPFLKSNFTTACMDVGGTIMSLGYQRIIQSGGNCPIMLLTGDTETSKTTVMRACLSIIGCSEVKN